MMSSSDHVAAAAPAFPHETRRAWGYDPAAVDTFLAHARRAFDGDDPQISASDVRVTSFPLARRGYRTTTVDAALTRLEDVLAARERDNALAHVGAGVWVDDARGRAQEVLDRLMRRPGCRFARVGMLHHGYRVDEVDLVSDKLADFLARGVTVTVGQVRTVAFRTQRGGYREAQVDAVLDAVVDIMLAVG